MSCSLKKINTCEILGDTMFDRNFRFNVIPENVSAKVLKIDSPDVQEIDLIQNSDFFSLEIENLNLIAGNYKITYQFEVLIDAKLVKKTFCVEDLRVLKNGCNCDDQKTTEFDFLIDVNETIIDVEILISQLNIGEGGQTPDLSSYAKKDSSNITNIVNWQTALNIYKLSEATAKNSSQDSAISANTSLIENEVTERQNQDSILAQSITDLNNVLNVIKVWKEQMTTPDVDSVANTVSEVLAVFQNVPEGANLIDLFNQKLNVSSVVNDLTSVLTDVPLSAYQGKVLNDLISALTLTVSNKVDKDGTKVLSDNNFTNTLKTKLDGLSNYTLPVASGTVLGGVKEVFLTQSAYNALTPKLADVKYHIEKV